MKSVLLVFLLINAGHSFLNFKKQTGGNNTDHRVFSNVKIYSNLAEIIVPLGKLPLEFSEDDWRDIRSDSVTLVGTNVTITEQTITEKKQSLNNAHVYVRAPSSSNTETKFLRATMIDERRNLVKLIDKDVSKDPIYFTPSPDQVVYESNPPQSKYYVDFKYGTTDAVFLSYIRSNLNWKTRYQLNMFGENKTPIMIAMADIRNDGQSRVDIDHADLLGGDINLQASRYPTAQFRTNYAEASYDSVAYAPGSAGSAPPKVGQAEEIAGLYVFSIDKAFSIEPKTNYALPMFRPTVKIEPFASITKQMYNTDNTRGKAQRSYRLTTDRYLSGGNVVIRENDHLVGETSLPNVAAKNSHEFSIGEDADVTYRENVTVISSRASSPSRVGSFPSESRKESTISLTVTFKNFKKNRSVKVEYKQTIYGQSIKLTTPNAACSQDSMTIKCSLTLAADEEKTITYKFDQVV